MNIKLLPVAALTTALMAQIGYAQLVISQNGKTTDTSATSAQPTAAKTTSVKQTTKVEKTETKASNSTKYKIDPNHGNVRFSIDHFKTTTNQGAFYGVNGDLDFDPAKRTGSIDVTIPINTLNTGNEHFTNHLKSAEFFNAEKYPTANFKSTQFYFKNGKVSQVKGNLTMLGKTNPVTLTATKFNCYDSPMLKAKVCGGDFETTIDRTQWGMDGYVNMGFSKLVKLNIQVEAAQQ